MSEAENMAFANAKKSLQDQWLAPHALRLDRIMADATARHLSARITAGPTGEHLAEAEHLAGAEQLAVILHAITVARDPCGPSHLAEHLAVHLDDRHSWDFYHHVGCMVAMGADPNEMMAAYRAATGPGVDRPGAVFAFRLRAAGWMRSPLYEQARRVKKGRMHSHA